MQDSYSSIEHNLKRQLSVFEKQSLKVGTLGSKVLLLPSVPPCPEVKELCDTGLVDVGDCVLLEHKQSLYQKIYDYYFEQCYIHQMSAADYLEKTKHQFNYIHLDWCGPIDMSKVKQFLLALNCLQSQARLRLTIMLARTNHTSLNNLYKILNLSEASHPATTLKTIMYMHQSLRLRNTVKVLKCPNLNLVNVTEYRYFEPGHSRTDMYTIWFDFEPRKLSMNIDTILNNKVPLFK